MRWNLNVTDRIHGFYQQLSLWVFNSCSCLTAPIEASAGASSTSPAHRPDTVPYMRGPQLQLRPQRPSIFTGIRNGIGAVWASRNRVDGLLSSRATASAASHARLAENRRSRRRRRLLPRRDRDESHYQRKVAYFVALAEICHNR